MDCCGNQLAAGRVVCPKPRRVGPSNLDNSMTPLRFHMRNSASAEALDSKFGGGLLDVSLCKEGFEAEGSGTGSSSPPPFFFGSPPCRAQNPLAQDDRFRVQKHGSTVSSPSDSDSVPSAHNRVKFGLKQAAVRVEGFDCQSSRVVAMA